MMSTNLEVVGGLNLGKQILNDDSIRAVLIVASQRL